MNAQLSKPYVSTFKTIATLSQATPVQNTWYTILDTTLNCRIYDIGFAVATTGETMEARIVVDGVTLDSVASACSAGTTYCVRLNVRSTGTTDHLEISSTLAHYYTFLIEGRSVKVEIRKTTATGTGTITATCKYGVVT